MSLFGLAFVSLGVFLGSRLPPESPFLAYLGISKTGQVAAAGGGQVAAARDGEFATSPSFVHVGRCSGTPLRSVNSTERLAECQSACILQKGCGYFAFDSDARGCLLYRLDTGCPTEKHSSSASAHDDHHRSYMIPQEDAQIEIIANSTAVTTATHTTTRMETTTQAKAVPTTRPSLFCFTVVQADTYELDIMRTGINKGAGIFDCEDWVVFSDEEVWITPGPPVKITTTVLPISLKAKAGKTEHILNTKIFMAAWDWIIKEKKYVTSTWMAKVDPDAVFVPARLREAVEKKWDPMGHKEIYIKNCPFSFGFYGALEVVSSGAIKNYAMNQQKCLKELQWQDWGEDLYMKNCFDHLGVKEVTDYTILADEYCGAKAGQCWLTAPVAFHPYKSAFNWFQCWDNVEDTQKGSHGEHRLI